MKGDVWVTIDKAITFDLNGHRIYDLTVRCKITLKGIPPEERAKSPNG